MINAPVKSTGLNHLVARVRATIGSTLERFIDSLLPPRPFTPWDPIKGKPLTDDEQAARKENEIAEAHALYKKVLRDVARMNDVRLPRAAIPTLYTYTEVQQLLEEYKRAPKDRTRRLSRQEMDVVRTYIARKAVNLHNIAYYNEAYEYIAFLYGASEEATLMHEVQHMIDTKIYDMDTLLSEFRANAVSAGMGTSAFGERDFQVFCNRAKESAGKRFVIYDILGCSVESRLGGILSYPFLCGVHCHRMRVIHHPTVRWIDNRAKFEAPYYDVEHWGVERYPHREIRKKVLSLTFKIHRKYGKTPAAKIFLKRYCGILYIPGSVWQFCQTGFPQETAERGDYSCKSLQKRAIECLEAIARGEH